MTAAETNNAPSERLLRKRLAARLRQQRCRARKREAMLLQKQQQHKEKRPNCVSAAFVAATARCSKQHRCRSCGNNRARREEPNHVAAAFEAAKARGARREAQTAKSCICCFRGGNSAREEG